MTKNARTFRRYSISFKQKVVREIEEEGLSISSMRRRYDIGGAATIQKWLYHYGKNHLLNKIVRIETMEEKDRIKQLEEEVRRLKLAYADVSMQRDILTTLVEVVNEHYATDVKKNSGAMLFNDNKKFTR